MKPSTRLLQDGITALKLRVLEHYIDLQYVFSRVQELEATLYPLSSVRPSVPVSLCPCVPVSVSIECFSPINHEQMIGSL